MLHNQLIETSQDIFDNNHIIKYIYKTINNVNLYYYQLNPESLDQNLISKLSQEEQQKTLKYKFSYDKNLYLMRHLLLKQILLEYNEYSNLYYNNSGKAILSNSNLKFSISKSKEYFITAISKQYQVGIDIERIIYIKDYKKIMSLFLHQEEVNIINLFPKQEHLKLFYRFWTAKEAIIKAVGIGMNIDLKSIILKLNGNDDMYMRSDSTIKQKILLSQFILDNNYISLAAIMPFSL